MAFSVFHYHYFQINDTVKESGGAWGKINLLSRAVPWYLSKFHKISEYNTDLAKQFWFIKNDSVMNEPVWLASSDYW